MSEQAPKGHEQFTAPEAEPSHEAAHHKDTPEHTARHEKHELAPVKELETQAKEQAAVAKDVISHEKGTKDEPTARLVSRELRQDTLNRTLTHIRKQLPTGERVLSKVIHQPAVEAISNVSAKTVARPSGILMGSICAFAGSSFFLWMAKRYGFQYNYLLFLILFAGGFLVGLFLELVISTLRRGKTNNH
jgi:hypothetical protein